MNNSLLLFSRRAFSQQRSVKCSQVSTKFSRRFFGSDVPATTTATTQAVAKASTATSTPKSGGSSFFQRLTAFLAGCGVGFGLSTYFVYNELVESNTKLERDVRILIDGKDK